MAHDVSVILTYHSIDASASVASITPELFRRQMESLARRNIRVLTLGEALETPGTVALTFDDAYENFYGEALPVLEQFGFPATVFVVTGFVGATADWPTQGDAAPRLAIMSWEQLRELPRRGVALGSHTHTHPPLSRLKESDLREELRSSRQELEQRVGEAAGRLAYPYGDWDGRVRRVASEYYALACTTRLQYARAAESPMLAPRIDAFYLRKMKRFEAVTDRRGGGYIGLRDFFRRTRASLPGKGPYRWPPK